MSKQNQALNIEKEIETHFQKPEPSAEFRESLGSQLADQFDRLEARRSSTQSEKSRQAAHPTRRWALAPAAVVIALALFVLFIGPAKVVAQVQALLGYIPGVGFIDVNEIRVLEAPITQTKGNVTITIKQVMIDSEDTVIVIGIDGLPSAEEILVDLGPLTQENEAEWLARNKEIWESGARLLLTDGEVLDQYTFTGAPWDGFFIFPSVRSSVLGFTLDFDRIPGVAEGKAPQGWHFDIVLMYVDGETYASLPQAQPLGIRSEPDPVFGVSLELLDMTQSSSETTLRLRLEGVPEGWMSQGYVLDAALQDDLGNIYPVIYGPTTGQDEEGVYLVSFQPVSPAARFLTLTAVNLSFRVPLAEQVLNVDVGSSPQIGDQFSMDQTVEVLGTPLHFTSMRIHDEADPYSQDEEPLVYFEFAIDPVAILDNMAVTGLEFSLHQFADQGFRIITSRSGSGINPESDQFTDIMANIGFSAAAPLPHGEIEILLSGANISLQGPFEITWEVNR